MAAGALFRDDIGRVLLVDAMYKPTWDLPGGAVEQEESPVAACRREVAEELGLTRPIGRVLAVDWVSSRPERFEGLIVVYDGGVLTETDIATITLQDGELAHYEFVPPDEVPLGEPAAGSPDLRLPGCSRHRGASLAGERHSGLLMLRAGSFPCGPHAIHHRDRPSWTFAMRSAGTRSS